jgi:hypothetical protein
MSISLGLSLAQEWAFPRYVHYGTDIFSVAHAGFVKRRASSEDGNQLTKWLTEMSP